jgi:hypothetical protein
LESVSAPPINVGPGSASYLGYLKNKVLRGQSGTGVGGAGGRQQYTEMVGPQTPPGWADGADAFVREAASDAMRRLSGHGSAQNSPLGHRGGGTPAQQESEALFLSTAQLLQEEEQRRRAAFASMGESDAGREVYATAVRQQLGRLTRRFGAGRGGADTGARDNMPEEVRAEYTDFIHQENPGFRTLDLIVID